MTRRILDYDPLSGVTTYFDFTPDQQMHLTTVQDVTPLLDQSQMMRNEDEYTRHGIKQDQWHYARVPDVVAMEMLQKYGVDMMKTPIDWPSVLRCINTHYPYLKTTTKHHDH